MDTKTGVKIGFALVALALILGTELHPLKVIAALAACYGIFRAGFAVLGSMATPVPDPPPPGELRKVRMQFRCTLCGTEVRMTMANDEMPTPPRHCMEDMEFVAPTME